MPGFSIKRYERAAAAYEVLAHQLKGKVVVKLEGHTYIHYTPGDAIALTLHETDILTFYRDGRVRFDTGGWPTMFTDQRMNKYCPEGLSVSSDRGKWMLFVQTGSERGVGNEYRFYDGITVDLNTRQVVSSDPGTAAWDEWNKNIDKKIKKYVDALTSETAEEAYIDANEFGCSSCWPRDRSDVEGQKWQEDDGVEHYLQHIDASVYSGWMLHNALREAGYRPDSYLYNPGSWGLPTIKKTLTKFLRRRLYKGVTAVR